MRHLPILGLLITTALLAGSPLLDAQEDRWVHWGETEPDPAKVETELAKVRAFIQDLPGDAAEGTPKANLRVAATRRVQLLEELSALLTARDEAEGLLTNLEKIPALRQELDRLRDPGGSPPAEAPAAGEPTMEGFEALQRDEVALRGAVEQVQSRLADAARRADQAATTQRGYEDRLRLAQERIATLQGSLATTAAGDAMELIRLQLSNSRLNARIATTLINQLRRTIAIDSELESYRNLALQVAEAKLQRHQERLDRYSTALSTSLQSDQEARETLLIELREVAESSQDPVERFFARWQVEIAVSENSFAGVQPIQLDVTKEVTEQQERLESNRKELDRLRVDVKRYGTSGAVGTAIQRTFQQLPQRRSAVRFSVKPRFEEKFAAYSNRRFDVDQLLFELNERFQTEIGEAQVGLDPIARRRFLARAEGLRSELRTKLQQERRALSEAIGKIEQLTLLRTDRLATLEELEAFIQTKVFLIQDVPPFGLDEFRELGTELGTMRDKSVALVSKGSLTELKNEFGSTERILWAILVALGLPFLTLWIRRLIKRSLRREGIEEGRGAFGRVVLLFFGLIQVLLFPAALWTLSVCLERLSTSSGITELAARIIRGIALLVFLRGTGRVFFSKNSLSVRLSLLRSETALQLFHSLRTISLAVLLFLVPWIITVGPPYELSSSPRLFFVLFLAMAGFAVYRSFRGSSSIFRDWLGETPGVGATRLVRAWSLLLALSLLAIPLLELTGRRFAAKSIGTSLLLSLATWIVLPILYQMIVPILERWASTPPPPPAEGEEPDPVAFDAQARRARVVAGARLTLGLIGIGCFIVFWGINERVWNVMKEWDLYTRGVDAADGTVNWVTAGDLLFAILAMIFTGWLLRHLPGIYDMTIFPRFPVDRGLRYAIVTISRYGLFFVGALIAFRSLQLDLTQLGWLIAAMGIGLGFGLQEIVSNFVSGLILLVERPIRVGDLITVGSVIGRVQRINIRATTVLNGDRQEVIVPNRSLIASEVTNWTLKDQVVRLKVLIGVAYGSDITTVRRIILEAAQADPDVMADPCPQLFFVNHGESSLDFELWVFVAGPQLRFPAMDRLNESINRTLDAHGIEIPFPQRDLHVRSGSLVAPSPEDATR